jgi:lantibiotic modifying enzyme
MTFNFEIKTEEYKFLNKILTRVIEYNGDDVFNYVDFYETVWSNVIQQYESDKSVSTIKINIPIKKILILHHLIKDYKVKGITEEFRYFRNILYKIAETNKLFNAYNIIVERIKDDCKLWGNALDEVLSNKNNNTVKDINEVIDADVQNIEIKKEV